MDRRIAHLDMDAFFASVSLLRYPELRGFPVVIGGRRAPAPQSADGATSFPRLRDYAGRGVVTTATYEARAFGVHSAMPLMKAASLAPDAILLPAQFDDYSHYSALFKQAVRAVTPQVEDRGIDEIYIDLTAEGDDSTALALSIKGAVRAATGLTCSIGIAPNKLLAKIASELDKPDGLTLLQPDDVPARIWPLDVRKINGIGPKASARLAALDIRTIGQLAAADPGMLAARFGERYGGWLRDAAHGRDDRPVVTERERKSMSRETTFERDLHPERDRDSLSSVLLDLCRRLAEDLRSEGLRTRSVGVKIRYSDFRTLTRDHTLEQATADTEAIRSAARLCLRRVPLDRKVRLLGVRAGTLLLDDGRPDARQLGFDEAR